MVVVGVLLEVLGELADALGEDGDLDFRRTGVTLVVLLASITTVFWSFVIIVTSILSYFIASRAAKYRLKGGRKLSAAVKRSIILPHSPPLVKNKIMEKRRIPEKRA